MTSEEIRTYLEGLAIGEPLILRAIEMVDKDETLYGERPMYVFVDDERDDTGARVYKSLWTFYDGGISEHFNWAQGNELRADMVGVSQGLLRVEFSRRQFEFGNASDESRLTVSMKFWGDVTGTLSATGSNCEVLSRVLRRYLLPKVR